VDAIVSGHTHSLVDTDVNGVPIVQGRSSGTAFDVIDLGPDGAVHRVRDVLPDSLTADPAVASIVATAVQRVAPLVNQPVATIATDLNRDGNQYALGNLIADAMRVVGKGDVGIMNNGGIRANLRAGPASYGSLFEVQPFANVLYRFTISGKTLRDYFEKLVARRPSVHIAGAVISYDSTSAAGSRVTRATVGGSELKDDAQYVLVTNDFMATGGDGLGLAAGATRTEILPIVDLDALIEYLKGLPQPVRAPTEPRFLVVPPSR
jgi:2',3'-cyclic-nucleotide 2'-phosphodiesterase (5'-nucleotidase family)